MVFLGGAEAPASPSLAPPLNCSFNQRRIRAGVLVNEYFPDVGQFLEKAKNFMTESCFSNKEVYRLKKIVRKLNMNLNDGSEKV